jgi:hypothetical protein
MWKPVAVVGLWLTMIAAPHLGRPAGQVSVANPQIQVATAVPTDDPGDPYLENAKPTPAARPPEQGPSAFMTVHFKNGLDKTLTLVQASLTMDGTPLARVGNFTREGDNVVFKGHVAPGPHVVTTRLGVLGRRRWPFTYLKDFKWQLVSEQTLNVIPGRAMAFTIKAVRKKGMNVPLDKQVGVTVFNELVPGPVTLNH